MSGGGGGYRMGRYGDCGVVESIGEECLPVRLELFTSLAEQPGKQVSRLGQMTH